MDICYASHVVGGTREEYGKQLNVSSSACMHNGVSAISLTEGLNAAKYGEEAAMLASGIAVEYVCDHFDELIVHAKTKATDLIARIIADQIANEITNSPLFKLDNNSNINEWLTSLQLVATDGKKVLVISTWTGPIFYKTTGNGLGRILCGNSIENRLISRLIGPMNYKPLDATPEVFYEEASDIEGFLMISNSQFINHNPEGFKNLASEIINEARWWGAAYGQRYVKVALEELANMHPEYLVGKHITRDLGMAVLAIESPMAEGTE